MNFEKMENIHLLYQKIPLIKNFFKIHFILYELSIVLKGKTIQSIKLEDKGN